MKKALLLSFIFIAVISGAYAISNNTIEYIIQGDFTNMGNVGNASGLQVYWVITEQPTQIKGNINGTLSYVGFFPFRDSYTYYVPFTNGIFIFHCSPDDVKLDNSLICTGTLFDGNGTAINNAHIDWRLYSYNGTLLDMGDFIFIGNGGYKFIVTLPSSEYVTGNYYFTFTSTGFTADYNYPFYLSSDFFMQNSTMLFALTMIVLGVVSSIFGYWRKVTLFVILGAFSMIITAMYMLDNQSQFGPVVSTSFGIILSLIGVMLLITMFLEKWRENRR